MLGPLAVTCRILYIFIGEVAYDMILSDSGWLPYPYLRIGHRRLACFCVVVLAILCKCSYSSIFLQIPQTAKPPDLAVLAVLESRNVELTLTRLRKRFGSTANPAVTVVLCCVMLCCGVKRKKGKLGTLVAIWLLAKE